MLITQQKLPRLDIGSGLAIKFGAGRGDSGCVLRVAEAVSRMFLASKVGLVSQQQIDYRYWLQQDVSVSFQCRTRCRLCYTRLS